MNTLRRVIANNIYNNQKSLLISKDDIISRKIILHNLCKYIIQNSGKTIVITAPSFRQVKILAEEMKELGYNSVKNNDYCKLIYNNNQVYFIPCTNGDKVRGLRADYLIIYNTCVIPYEVFQIICYGSIDTSKVLLCDSDQTIRNQLIEDTNKAGYYIGCIW